MKINKTPQASYIQTLVSAPSDPREALYMGNQNAKMKHHVNQNKPQASPKLGQKVKQNIPAGDPELKREPYHPEAYPTLSYP